MIWRYRSILILLMLSFAAILFRLFYWQIVRASDLSLLGQTQYERSLLVTPERGEIKTSDGFPIVANKISYLIYANPKQIKDKKKTSILLSSKLNVKEDLILSKLSLDKYWVSLKEEADIKEKEEITSLSIPGIGFEETYERFYPEASLSAHLLGFVGKDDFGKDKGYFGIEGYYGRLLSGKKTLKTQIYDALGLPILQETSGSVQNLKGNTLHLSIDRTIQFIVEQKLKEGMEKYQASGGMVGVMDPKTGNILALSSFPSFEPSDYGKYNEDLYKNPFISNLYEPGSTFKPFIMSAALDTGIITPQTKCNICDGPLTIGGFELHTWNNKYYKDTNMVEVIQHSDNIGMVFVGQKLGVEEMINYLDKFGIGNPTGIDLQGEVSQSLPPKDSWYSVDLATRAFGQGISVTAIELLSAFSAVANKGVRMEPHVVSSVEDKDGNISKISPKVLGRPISEKTAKVMTEILVNAVNKGEASWTRLKGYRIAGKTGTASIPIKGHYDPEKTVASFIGYAPSNDPKFVMLVIFDKPTTSIYGSETAAPVFFKIAKEILLYFGISPSGE